MTAVLSSNMVLLDRWSLNNSDMALLTGVRINDFSCHFRARGCMGQIMGLFCVLSSRSQSLTRTIFSSASNLSLDKKKKWYEVISMIQADCKVPQSLPSLLFISHRSLIKVEWFPYWPCGRGSRPCPQCWVYCDCWPLFAVLSWSEGIA